MIEPYLFTTACVRMVAGFRHVARAFMPRGDDHTPQCSDPPLLQLDKMQPARVRWERGRDGTWTKIEVYQSPNTGLAYAKKTKWKRL